MEHLLTTHTHTTPPITKPVLLYSHRDTVRTNGSLLAIAARSLICWLRPCLALRRLCEAPTLVFVQLLSPFCSSHQRVKTAELRDIISRRAQSFRARTGRLDRERTRSKKQDKQTDRRLHTHTRGAEERSTSAARRASCAATPALPLRPRIIPTSRNTTHPASSFF